MTPRRVGLPLLFFILALLIRVWHLSKQSLWMDEAFSVWVASHPIAEVMSLLRSDAHPPLFYGLLHAWLAWGGSEAHLRLPFVVCGGINAVLVYVIGRRLLGTRVGVLAALFWVFSFMALDQETQVRMYALGVTFSLLSTLACWNAFANPTWRNAFLYFLSAALALYTHYYLAFVILSHVVFFLVKRRFRLGFGVSAALGLGFLPWFSVFALQFQHQVDRQLPAAAWSQLLFFFASMLGMNDFLMASGALRETIGAAALILAVFGASRLSEARDEIALLVLLVVIPCGIPFGISHFTPRHIFVLRYVILFAPYFLLLFFAGLLALKRAVVFPVFASLVTANFVLWILFLTGPAYGRQNWREAANLLFRSLEPGDAVFVGQTMAFYPLWYYSGGALEIGWKASDGEGGRAYIDPKSARGAPRVAWFDLLGEEAPKFLPWAVGNSKRQWVVLCQDVFADPKRKGLNWFLSHRHVLRSWMFRSMRPGNEIFILLCDHEISGLDKKMGSTMKSVDAAKTNGKTVSGARHK